MKAALQGEEVDWQAVSTRESAAPPTRVCVLWKLTAPGEILMRYYKNLSKESARLYSEIEALQGLRRGHVNFGMPEGLTRDFMPKFFADFSSRYPGISFSVKVAGSPALGEELLSDDLDACPQLRGRIGGVVAAKDRHQWRQSDGGVAPR